MMRSICTGVFFVLMFLSGCGSDQKYVPVSGKVTYNGEPLAGVQVIFQPIADKGMDAGGVGSVGMTDANGNFSLEASTPTPTKGAFVGKHRIQIAFPPSGENAVSDDSDAANPGGAQATPKLATQAIPSKYNTESTLTFEVPRGGTNAANFDLEGPALPKGKGNK